MSKKLTTADFIKAAMAVHGSKYNYDNVVYTGSHGVVVINCPHHGNFTQKAYAHTTNHQGCPACGTAQAHHQSNRPEVFLSRARGVHGNRYDYSNTLYVTTNQPVTITCLDHGDFVMTPKMHLQGQGCRTCGYKSNSVGLDQFIKRSTEKHGRFYDYSAVDYQRIDIPVTIGCPVHGEFAQQPAGHMRGHGCPSCAREQRHGGFSCEYFDTDPSRRNEPGLLYVMRLYNDTENFIKIGITTQTVTDRWSGQTAGYNYEVLHSYTTTIHQAFCIEQRLLDNLRNYQYFPSVRFSGWTECVMFVDSVILLIDNELITSTPS